MAFGENVGSAYVKLYADGDEVPKDISDALDKLEPVMRKAGEDHADAYHKGFDKQSEKDSDTTRDRLYKNLQKGLGRMDAIGRTMGTDLFDGLQLQLTDELGDSNLAKLIRDKLEDDFALTGSWDRLSDSLRDVNRLAVTSQMDIDKFEASIRETIDATDDMSDSTENWREGLKETKDAMRELANEIDAGDSHMSKYLSSVIQNDKASRAWTDSFRDRLHSLNVELDHSATMTGKIFGKGSRNDFLNIVGASVEGLTRLVYTVPNLAERLFGGGEGGGGGGGGGFVSIARGVAGSIVGLGVAVAAIVAAMGPLAALLSGISAAVIALASSLAFAAAAVVGVAAVLAGPLVAAATAVVSALIGMDDQTRKVVNGAINALGKKFKDAGDAAGEAFGPKLTRAVALLDPALRGMNGMFSEIGSSLGDITINLAKATESKGFHDFQAAFADFIPGALTKLGEIAQNTIGGIGGMLRTAIPITSDFLDWMVKVTDEFSKWANSGPGQGQLLKFFERAADSAKSVWYFVRELGGAIAELIDQGQGAGNSIFDTMGDQLQKFTDYLESHPDAVADFFANGVQVAKDLGRVVLEIGNFIDEFDTEDTRKELHDILRVLADIIGLLGKVGGAAAHQWQALATVIHGVEWVIEQVGWAAKATGDLIVHAVQAPDKALTSLRHGIAGLDWGGMYNSARNALQKVGHAALGVRNDIVGWFRGLGNKLEAAIGKVNWGGIIQDPTARVVGWFRGMANRIESKIGQMSWGSILDDPTGHVVEWFKGLGNRIMKAIGSIDIHIDWPSPPKWLGKIAGPLTASGGVFDRPQQRTIAEAGREAVVPLNRPLNQVDPSVRGLSAVAQGLAGTGGMRVEAGAIVVHEAADGRATAAATLNRLVALAY